MVMGVLRIGGGGFQRSANFLEKLWKKQRTIENLI